jgi:hypothetical protein
MDQQSHAPLTVHTSPKLSSRKQPADISTEHDNSASNLEPNQSFLVDSSNNAIVSPRQSDILNNNDRKVKSATKPKTQQVDMDTIYTEGSGDAGDDGANTDREIVSTTTTPYKQKTANSAKKGGKVKDLYDIHPTDDTGMDENPAASTEEGTKILLRGVSTVSTIQKRSTDPLTDENGMVMDTSFEGANPLAPQRHQTEDRMSIGGSLYDLYGGKQTGRSSVVDGISPLYEDNKEGKPVRRRRKAKAEKAAEDGQGNNEEDHEFEDYEDDDAYALDEVVVTVSGNEKDNNVTGHIEAFIKDKEDLCVRDLLQQTQHQQNQDRDGNSSGNRNNNVTVVTDQDDVATTIWCGLPQTNNNGRCVVS